MRWDGTRETLLVAVRPGVRDVYRADVTRRTDPTLPRSPFGACASTSPRDAKSSLHPSLSLALSLVFRALSLGALSPPSRRRDRSLEERV